MRMIKFRAQDIASNKWLFGDIRHHNIDVCIFEQGGNRGELVKPETIGQFTGLYDKHGHEIYEGDVIQHRNEKVAVQFYRGAFGYSRLVRKRIRFAEGASRVEEVMKFVPFIGSDENSNALMFPDGTVFDTDFCEVIGNIHDNPELLEKGGKK